MLKANSKMFHDLCEEGIKDDKKDVFVEAFTEFIAELDDTDLSNKTKQHLYDIFIKDMNIYFKNKKYEGKQQIDMLKTLIGKRVATFDGHIGVVIKHFKPTGRDMTVHIKQDDGRIWYCPENNIVEVKE